MSGILATLLTADLSIRIVRMAADFGMVVMFVGFVLCLIRLVRGPHLADRAIALDTIAIHVIGIVILFTMRLDSLVFFDGALVLSLLGFAGTIAAGQYIARPHVQQRRHRDPALHRTDD